MELHCHYRVIIPANASWYKDGINLPENDDLITILPAMNGVSTLTISSVRVGDAGRYTCTVMTSVGRNSSFIDVDIGMSWHIFSQPLLQL